MFTAQSLALARVEKWLFVNNSKEYAIGTWRRSGGFADPLVLFVGPKSAPDVHRILCELRSSGGNADWHQLASWAPITDPPAGAGDPGVPQKAYLSAQEAASALGVDVRRLRELAKTVGNGVPGGPVRTGSGRVRAHRKWPADSLQDWYRAALAASEAAPSGKGSRRRRRPQRGATKGVSSESGPRQGRRRKGHEHSQKPRLKP